MSTAVFDKSVFRHEPTPSDIQAANEGIHKHEGAISALQERILALQAEVRDLRKEQQVHLDGISYCRGVVTLARRIPEELLSKIFEHCVDDGWTRAPIVVSHVCSSWRKAARAPRVWSRVYVECDAFDVLARTRFWLSMAREAPIDVYIIATWRVPVSVITELMDVLLQRVSQWRSIFVTTSFMLQTNCVFQKLTCAAINLEEVNILSDLELEGGDLGEDGTLSLAGHLGSVNVPKLRSMSFTSNVLPIGPIFPIHIRELTLDTKTSPAIRPLSTSSILSLLEGLTALQSLTIIMPLDYVHPFVSTTDPSLFITLPELASLTLYGPTDLNEILPHFVTPALKQLRLRSLEDIGYRQHPIALSLMRFLAESTPRLELLELHDIDLSPEGFSACFTALPTLRELYLHESSISDATIQLLHGPAGLCPRLTRLDLRWCGHLGGAALVDLVRSRNVVVRDGDGAMEGAADPISEVAVMNCCFVKEQDVLDLAQMSVCRVVMRDGFDYCRARGCCVNARYRTRLWLRHMSSLSAEERLRLRLIV